MRRNIKRVSALIITAMMLALSTVTAFCVDSHYYIKDLDMNLNLPADMLVITRESDASDKYFSMFGLDYDTTMKEFTDAGVYLQGMFEDSSKSVTVSMVENDNSKKIQNYNRLPDDQLQSVQNSFLNSDNYKSCNVVKNNDVVFLELVMETETDGQVIHSTQANTVVDGMSITINLQPKKGTDLQDSDYSILSDIMQSVKFSENTDTLNPVMIACVSVAAVIVIALIIVVIVIVKKRRKSSVKPQKNLMEKKNKNDKILRELSNKYTSAKSHKNTGDQVYYGDSENAEDAEDIIRELRQSDIKGENNYQVSAEIDNDYNDNNVYGESYSDTSLEESLYATAKLSKKELREAEKALKKQRMAMKQPANAQKAEEVIDIYSQEPQPDHSALVEEEISYDNETANIDDEVNRILEEKRRTDEIEKEENVSKEYTNEAVYVKEPKATQEDTPEIDVPQDEMPQADAPQQAEADEITTDNDDEAGYVFPEEKPAEKKKHHPHFAKEEKETCQENFENDGFDDDGFDDEDEEQEQEVKGSESSFEQSEDYFDEAPDKRRLYANDTVEEAVLGKKKSKTAKIDGKKAAEKAKTFGAVILNGILIFANAIKSFFIHFGYFISNIVKLIKRKHNVKKRKKAEEERRRKQQEERHRKEESAKRREERRRAMEQQRRENGLVQVRNHGENRPSGRSSSRGTNRNTKQ